MSKAGEMPHPSMGAFPGHLFRVCHTKLLSAAPSRIERAIKARRQIDERKPAISKPLHDHASGLVGIIRARPFVGLD